MDTKSVQPEMPELLTCEEVFDKLGLLSQETVDNWLCGGNFPGSKFIQGAWYFEKTKVEQVVETVKQLRKKNAAGDLTPVFDDDEDEKGLTPPAL